MFVQVSFVFAFGEVQFEVYRIDFIHIFSAMLHPSWFALRSRLFNLRLPIEFTQEQSKTTVCIKLRSGSNKNLIRFFFST